MKSPVRKNFRGVTLVEATISIGVFSLFAIGIYSAITLVFQVVFQSRITLVEIGLANEQIEIIQNLDYDDVGTLLGSPSGLLEKVVTTTIDGNDYSIVRTVRYYDDPYDFTADGTPGNNQKVICHNSNTQFIASSSLQAHLGHGDYEGVCIGDTNTYIDTVPADYKNIFVDVTCTSCSQLNPVKVTTQIVPSGLEGSSSTGHLFVRVFDANAQPVSGARVDLFSPSTNPVFSTWDITDNKGFVRWYNLDPAFQAYRITSSLAGYSVDYTLEPVVLNPNPTRPNATISSSTITEISFSIDRISTINIDTVDNVCNGLSGVDVNIFGTKLDGSTPNVLRYNKIFTSDVLGEISRTDIAWDDYNMTVTGYDIIGTIPDLPLTVQPGATQSVELLLGVNTANSLLANVRDSVTGLPLAGVLNQLSGGSYSKSYTTGVGFKRQTDWSGGPGQLLYIDNDEYDNDDGNIEYTDSPGDLKLLKIGQNYVTNAELESSVFDFGGAVQYIQLLWEPIGQISQVGTSSVRFQLASSNTTTGSWKYLGPDASTSTYYTASTPDINSVHDGDAYMRYKIFLQTASTTFTPVVSDVQFTYTNVCTPPGQSYFTGMAAGTYQLISTVAGYSGVTNTISVTTNTVYSIELAPL